MNTLGYLNHGRWVADCPVRSCGDAVALYPEDRQGNPSPRPVTSQVCANGHPLSLQVPDDEERLRIEQAVMGRPRAADRSWYPKGHPMGEYGFPTGQTIAELEAETEMLARRDAPKVDRADPDHIRDVLAGLGVVVSADGAFTGNLNTLRGN